MKRIQVLALGLATVVGAVLMHGQAITEDEVRVVSGPYVPRPLGTIRVESNMVEVGVVVRDFHGKPVPRLTKDDFQIFDSGRQQVISHFSIEEEQASASTPVATVSQTSPAAPAPVVAPPLRYIGFYFDDANIPTSDLVFARKAAEKFVNTSMGEGDKVAVFTSSATVTQTFTTDKQKLIAAIREVRSHFRQASYGAGSCPHMDPYQAYQILLNWNVHSAAFDLALAEAEICECLGGSAANCAAEASRLVEVQAQVVSGLADQFAMNTLGVLGDIIKYVGKMPGRRMLVMTSSGFFSRSNIVKMQQDKLINAALHSGIRINTLDAKGLSADWIGGNPADGPPLGFGGAMGAYADELASDERDVSNDAMALLAAGTGGTFFHNSNDLDGGVRQIAAMPEVSYNLGFSPAEVKYDGSYHSLKVKLLNGKGYAIEARPGYYAPGKSNLAKETKFESLNKEVMGSQELHGLPAGVETKPVKLATGESALNIAVRVDIRSLPFKKENGRHVERLIFITALFDDKNKFLSGVEGIMDMTLKDATLNLLGSTGTSASVTLQAPPGIYRLRQVVQEVVTGKIAAFNTPVEIH